MSNASNNTNDTPQDFDACMEEIETLIERIESGEIGLEEQLKAYERGAELLRSCRSMLDAAELKVSAIEAGLSPLEAGGGSADDGASTGETD